MSTKKLAECEVGLHESLVVFHQKSQAAGIVVHLVCRTKKGAILLVDQDGVWSFPKEALPLVGTLILAPDAIIKRHLGRNPAELRGSSPACKDTEIIGQYEDERHVLHIVLRANVSDVTQKNWKHPFSANCLSRLGDCSEVVHLTTAALGWKPSETSAVAEKVAA